MARFKFIIIAVILSISGLLFSGCGGSTGTVTMRLTDAPVDAANIKSVYITVTGLSFHMEDDEEWITVDEFDGPREYDLLSLTGGITSMLGEFSFPAGKVTQMRFMLDAPVTGSGSPSNPGCYVVLTDNTEKPLFVPSGFSSGFKAVGSFDVPVNGTVSVTADFDVRKSLRETSGTYNLQPTIRTVVDGEAGTISGGVTGASNTVVVFAYENGSYKDTEPTADPSFGSAVSSSPVKDSSYTIPFLAAGTYDVVAAEFDAAGAYISGSAVVYQDIIVTSGETSTQAVSF